MTTADPKNLESKLQPHTQSTRDDPDDTKNPEPTKEVGTSKTGHLSDAHMSIDKPIHDLEDQGAPPELPPPPAYQPRDMNKSMAPHIENIYLSEQEGFVPLEDDNRKWHDSPGNGSDLVGQSSGDDFSDEDDLGAEDDELEDDQYFEDEFSDDIQEMDDLTHPKDTFVYDTQGPYLPHQHAGHVRKLNPSHIQRKRPLLLKTTSNLRLETTNAIPASVDPSTATEEQQFLLGCSEVTRQMHQGNNKTLQRC